MQSFKVESIVNDDVINHLIESSCLSEDQQEQLSTIGEREDKTKALIQILCTKDEQHFKEVLKGLRTTDSGWLAEVLEKKLEEIHHEMAQDKNVPTTSSGLSF